MINVEQLCYRYPQAKSETLRGLGFSVKQGEVFGFLGPSGAGKSTTQKILTGVTADFSGRADVLGQPITSQGRGFYERVGISFEFPNVYNRLTGRENLAFFASMYGGDTVAPERLLQQVGLDDDADTLVSRYSKGMKMRLNFCRAFLNQPELVFLDEPTSGQDPVNACRLKELITDKKKQGLTVFLTTHDMHVAQELCDRVAFIVDGEIKLIDSPKAMMLAQGKRQVQVEYGTDGDSHSQLFDLAGLADNPDFDALLRRADLQTIHTLEASLEQVFIEVTGARLL